MLKMRTFASDSEGTQLLFSIENGQIQQRAYTMSDLRRLRVSLKMGINTAADFLGLSQTALSNYERNVRIIPDYLFDMYYEYLMGCKRGEIVYTVSKARPLLVGKKSYDSVSCVDKCTAKGLRAIRKNLGLTLMQVSQHVNIHYVSIGDKERGKYQMLKTEYEALMKFYRAEKLRRIFGRNYKGE